jgi:hypothetical protein
MSTIGDIVSTNYIDREIPSTGISGMGGGSFCRANGNYFICVWRSFSSGNPIAITTVHIDPDTGAITAVDVKSSWLSGDFVVVAPFLISEGIVAFGYVGDGADPRSIIMCTVSVDTSGNIGPAPIASTVIFVNGFNGGTIGCGTAAEHVVDDMFIIQLHTTTIVSETRHYQDSLLTIKISSDGTSIIVLDTHELVDTTVLNYPTTIPPCRVYQNIFAVGMYGGYSTVNIDITTGAITVIDTSGLGVSDISSTSVLRLGNGWFLGTGYTTSVRLYTFHISNDGSIDDTFTAVQAVVSNQDIYIELLGVSSTTAYILVQWRDSGSDRYLTTYSINIAGIIAIIETREWETDWGALPMVLHIGTKEMFSTFGYTSSIVHLLTHQVGIEAIDIASVTPSSGLRGSTIDVVIVGTGLNNIRRWNLGDAIQINYFQVDSSTQVTANITISIDAVAGLRDLTGYLSGGTVVLEDAFTVLAIVPHMVTNIIHRYDRMNRIYNLELVIGGVTSEFGMPEWTTRPVPMIKNEPDPAVAEEVKKQVNVTIPTIWGGPSGTMRALTPEDLARPGTRSDAGKGNKIWQALTPWKESGGQTIEIYGKFTADVIQKSWRALTPWDDSHKIAKIAKLSNKAEEVFQREFGLSSKQVQKYLNAGLTLDDIRAQFGKEKNP